MIAQIGRWPTQVLMRLPWQSAILFVLATYFLQLLPHRRPVANTIAGWKFKFRTPTWCGRVFLGSEKPFDDQVGQLLAAHGRLESC